MLLRVVVSVASPLLALLSYLIPGCAGFASVRLFERRHAAVRSSWHGFGIGALTGLLCFVPSLLLQIAVLAQQGREAVLGPLRDQAEGLPMSAELLEILKDPAVFATAVAFAMIFECVLMLGSSGAGGAVAAATGHRRSGTSRPVH